MEGSRMMGERLILAGLLATIFVVQPIQADETTPGGKSPSGESTPAAVVADDPRLPPLPYQRLVELGSKRGFQPPSSVVAAEALKVTPEQREKIAGITTAGQRYETALST